MPSTRILIGHVLDELSKLEPASVHCAVTSPPYWGLRDYKTKPQQWADGPGTLGLEPTLDLYLAHLLEVFRAVRRVLRDDGTLWVNVGDSYGSTGLCQMPSCLAIAMQDDGWILRSRIIWAKGLSFCDTYAGSVMPESLNGWRWERCKHPGCPKCEPNGGYVLRKGSWRPTSSYEEVLMFAKTKSYFCDAEAVREKSSGVPAYHPQARLSRKHQDSRPEGANRFNYGARQELTGRNLRSVWVINPRAFREAHFATFPEKLIEPIIKAATSEKGICSKCGAPWCRMVIAHKTLGWRPTCRCSAGPPQPATILDPFIGSGTTALVAKKLGRDCIGIELNAEYAAMARKRVAP